MFHIVRPGTNIDFVGKRKIWLVISCMAVLGTIALFFTKGLNYGIDFSGGAEIQVKVPSEWQIGTLRTKLTEAGLTGVRVQQIGEASNNEYLIRARGDAKNLDQISGKVSNTLAQSFSADQYEVQRADVVGPAAGTLLKKRGLQAMFFALLVILIYVTIRFDSRYAPGAILALFHDSAICIGVFILTQRTFDLSILAAVLALIGYSNNDTIIIYDRVREVTHLHPDWSIEKAVNRALNDTLGRTLVTSITTFFVVFCLWRFGGAVLENFAFTLLVGVMVGTYSSIFIASSIIITLTNYRKEKEAKLKASGGHSKKRRRYEVRANPADSA